MDKNTVTNKPIIKLMCRECCSKFHPPNNGGVGQGYCEQCYQYTVALYEVDWFAAVYIANDITVHGATEPAHVKGELLGTASFDSIFWYTTQALERWRYEPFEVCQVGGGLIKGKSIWRDGIPACESCDEIRQQVYEAMEKYL